VNAKQESENNRIHDGARGVKNSLQQRERRVHEARAVGWTEGNRGSENEVTSLGDNTSSPKSKKRKLRVAFARKARGIGRDTHGRKKKKPHKGGGCITKPAHWPYHVTEKRDKYTERHGTWASG